ncbi:MAG: patatin-like phospholipase family protein [Lachnospiraceae bacterium]|nr:patatin-like phospholipase family protein [Lachnospiraceae bacterium]
MTPVLDLDKEYGLVLEGGGAKGAYQIGAWKALREAGVKIKGVAGTSVGALNGALICMDDLEQAEELWRNIAYSKVMDVDDERMKRLFERNLEPEMLREVLRDTLRILVDRGTDITPLRRLIAENIDEERIRKSPMEFYSCTYSITDHRELDVDMKQVPEGQMQDMLLASAYLPVFKNVKLHGKTYMDGGLTNVLPVNALLERGYTDLILLRIYGVGWERRVEIPQGVQIYEIAPRVSLGSTLQFDAGKSRQNMRTGYYDALRLLYGLSGKIYYIEESQEEWYYLERILSGKPQVQDAALHAYKRNPESGGSLRTLVEVVLPLAAEELRLPKGWDYRLLYLSMLEATARQFRVPKYEVYTPSTLLDKIRKRAASAENLEELPGFMRLILDK